MNCFEQRGVTVVTPALNQRHYIDSCLRSVRRQDTSLPIQHLVIDGGSEDGTRELVLRAKGPELVELADSSQSQALNWGFRHARHQLICWLNADDVLLPGAFAYVDRQVRDLSTRFYLFSSFVEIDERNRVKKLRPVPPFCAHAIRNFATYIPTSGSFFPKQIVVDGLLLDEKLDFIMDRDFVIRLHERGYQFWRAKRYLAGFRVHPEQKSGAGTAMHIRRRERARVDRKHGGVWIGERRLVSWSRLLGWLAFVYVGVGWRFSRALAGCRRYRRGAVDWSRVDGWLQNLKVE